MGSGLRRACSRLFGWLAALHLPRPLRAPVYRTWARAFSVDLFLSRSPRDVQVAGDAGFASAQIYPHPPEAIAAPVETIRMAFDADAVLFSEESERIYRELDAGELAGQHGAGAASDRDRAAHRP